MTWITHGTAKSLSVQRLSRQTVAGVDVLLCWSQGSPFAYLNQCTHLNKPLDGGRLIAGQIQCPFHGATFDVRSGAALCGPAVTPLVKIPVKVEDGHVLFDMTANCTQTPDRAGNTAR